MKACYESYGISDLTCKDTREELEVGVKVMTLHVTNNCRGEWWSSRWFRLSRASRSTKSTNPRKMMTSFSSLPSIGFLGSGSLFRVLQPFKLFTNTPFIDARKYECKAPSKENGLFSVFVTISSVEIALCI